VVLAPSPCDDVTTLSGTTTNQTSVITFKRGAFVAGTPVQPVACRMRWANMDPAWVNDGPSQYVVLLRLMAQVTNYVRSSCLLVHGAAPKSFHSPSFLEVCYAPTSLAFFLIHRSHSISFTRAQGVVVVGILIVPKCF
jgi:hypothetical protein